MNMANEKSNGSSRKNSFLKITNLRDLTVKDVVKYVRNLHKHIRSQDKKLKKIRDKFKKCVRKLFPHHSISKWPHFDFLEYDSFQQKLYLKTLVDNLEQKVIAAAEEPPETVDQEPDADEEEQPSSQIIKDYVQDIKNAAENAQQMAGYIYEPTSGLYYHSETGYYYNAVSGRGHFEEKEV
jgi:OCRE domain